MNGLTDIYREMGRAAAALGKSEDDMVYGKDAPVRISC